MVARSAPPPRTIASGSVALLCAAFVTACGPAVFAFPSESSSMIFTSSALGLGQARPSRKVRPQKGMLTGMVRDVQGRCVVSSSADPRNYWADSTGCATW